MTAYTLSQIAAKLGGEVRGADISVSAVAPPPARRRAKSPFSPIPNTAMKSKPAPPAR